MKITGVIGSGQKCSAPTVLVGLRRDMSTGAGTAFRRTTSYLRTHRGVAVS